MSIAEELTQSLAQLQTEFKAGRATLAEATLTGQDSLEASYATALKLLSMNKDEAAVSLLSILTVMDCFDVRYWRCLGLALFKTQRAPLAVSVLDAAIAMHEDDVPSHCYRAEALIAVGNKSDAHAECEWVIAHANPQKEAAFSARAKALVRYTTPARG